MITFVLHSTRIPFNNYWEADVPFPEVKINKFAFLSIKIQEKK